jgi:hypothetical protein
MTQEQDVHFPVHEGRAGFEMSLGEEAR